MIWSKVHRVAWMAGLAVALLLTAQNAVAQGNGVVAVQGDRIEIGRGALDGVSEGALVALAPPGYTGEMTEAGAPALVTLDKVRVESSSGQITRAPKTGGPVTPGWIVKILRQNPRQRGSKINVRLIVDDSALRQKTSGDGTRGCAGIRKSLRLERAQAATEEISNDLPNDEAQVEVETPAPPTPEPTEVPPTPEPTPEPTAVPPEATPAPSPSKSPRPTASPTPTPPPPAEHDVATLSDFLVKITYLGGKGTDEVLASILIIGPGGDTLENVTVPIEKAAATVKELLDKYIRSEQSRQAILNLHNPEPGFQIELWLNVPGGPTAKTRSISVSEDTAEDEGNTIMMHRGERHTYGFRSAKDCYLVLYNVGPEGEINQLFPNMFMSDNFVKANETYTIPDPSYRTKNGKQVYFSVDRVKPVGLEMVKAIATLDRMPLTSSDIDQLEKEGFPSATPPPPDAQWEGAANSLAHRLAMTRSLCLSRDITPEEDTPENEEPEPTPPPEIQKTLEEIQEYLRDLTQWSDAVITFYTAD